MPSVCIFHPLTAMTVHTVVTQCTWPTCHTPILLTTSTTARGYMAFSSRCLQRPHWPPGAPARSARSGRRSASRARPCPVTGRIRARTGPAGRPLAAPAAAAGRQASRARTGPVGGSLAAPPAGRVASRTRTLAVGGPLAAPAVAAMAGWQASRACHRPRADGWPPAPPAAAAVHQLAALHLASPPLARLPPAPVGATGRLRCRQGHLRWPKPPPPPVDSPSRARSCRGRPACRPRLVPRPLACLPPAPAGTAIGGRLAASSAAVAGLLASDAIPCRR